MTPRKQLIEMVASRLRTREAFTDLTVNECAEDCAYNRCPRTVADYYNAMTSAQWKRFVGDVRRRVHMLRVRYMA